MMKTPHQPPKSGPDRSAAEGARNPSAEGDGRDPEDAGNGSTGDQISGQSTYAEDETNGKKAGLPAG